jgi:hypothetical protein
MSQMSLLLLDRALRYRQQANKARTLARGVPSEGVGWGLVRLAQTLERKATRLERMSGVTEIRERRRANACQMVPD